MKLYRAFIHGMSLVSAVTFALSANTSIACTVAFSNTNDIAKVAARTMDLYMDDMPTLVVFPRGTSHDGGAGDNSLKWKSKYGTVVLTAFHSTAVSDGLNEAGLAAHLLYLHGTEYEKRDSTLPAISNAIWAQYILDNFKTVDEAVNAIKQVQIVSTKVHGREWPLHLTIEDATGDSAIFEFINGKIDIHHGAQYNVMTNEPVFDLQLKNLKKYKLFGGKLPMPGDADPLSRFVRASSYLKTSPKPTDYMSAIANVLSVIRTTMVPFGAEDTSGGEAIDSWDTRWATLSDLTQKIYYFNSTTLPILSGLI
jgi:penicillin V acylase-like amidase (Ntn superfamily)